MVPSFRRFTINLNFILCDIPLVPQDACDYGGFDVDVDQGQVISWVAEYRIQKDHLIPTNGCGVTGHFQGRLWCRSFAAKRRLIWSLSFCLVIMVLRNIYYLCKLRPNVKSFLHPLSVRNSELGILPNSDSTEDSKRLQPHVYFCAWNIQIYLWWCFAALYFTHWFENKRLYVDVISHNNWHGKHQNSYKGK